MIGHARSDERGKYSGGQAGDQTKNEVSVTAWYNRPWNVVMWAKDPQVREAMAVAMEQACANDNIGYDQGNGTQDRYSLFKELRKVNWVMKDVKTPCETDCSNLVAACANCAGVPISEYIYTGNEKSAFAKTGLFEIHEEKTYVGSEDYLPRGAVLLYEGHHTAINLTNGKYCAASEKAPALNGWVKDGETWYYYENGKKLKRSWKLYDHHWYRLGIDGAMLTGWHKIYDNNNVLRDCYFQETGDLKGAQWKSDDNGYQSIWYVA